MEGLLSIDCCAVQERNEAHVLSHGKLTGPMRKAGAEVEADGTLCQQLWGLREPADRTAIWKLTVFSFSLMNTVKTKCRTFSWRGFEASMETTDPRDVFLEY